MEFANRKRNRLSSWDYSSSALYFVTFCTFQRRPLLGRIIHREQSDASIHAHLAPTPLGSFCLEEIRAVDATDERCKVLSFVVMPNHVHLLVELTDQPVDPQDKTTLSSIIGRLKRRVTQHARTTHPDMVVWQRSFYDHVLRSDKELERIFEYIENNPRKWALDRYYLG